MLYTSGPGGLASGALLEELSLLATIENDMYKLSNEVAKLQISTGAANATYTKNALIDSANSQFAQGIANLAGGALQIASAAGCAIMESKFNSEADALENPKELQIKYESVDGPSATVAGNTTPNPVPKAGDGEPTSTLTADSSVAPEGEEAPEATEKATADKEKTENAAADKAKAGKDAADKEAADKVSREKKVAEKRAQAKNVGDVKQPLSYGLNALTTGIASFTQSYYTTQQANDQGMATFDGNIVNTYNPLKQGLDGNIGTDEQTKGTVLGVLQAMAQAGGSRG